jgi:hypothetical protein
MRGEGIDGSLFNPWLPFPRVFICDPLLDQLPTVWAWIRVTAAGAHAAAIRP